MSPRFSDDSGDFEPLTRVQVLIAMGITAIALLLVSKLWLYFSKVPAIAVTWNPADALLGLGLGAAISGISAIAYRFWPQYRHSADNYLAIVLKPLIWADLIWLGLLPGMSEELLFRGVMFPTLGLTWPGLAVSSACFGLLHLSGLNQWPYAVWATAIGGLLGFGVWQTDNLLVPIVAHTTANLLSSSLWKLDAESWDRP